MIKVMLVDDEIGVRNSIRMKINWAAIGFEIVSEASNGREGLQLLESSPLPDLVITDIRMPQMDGIQFIRQIRSIHPELRIVVLSGYSDFDYLKASIQLGVKDYLLKPVVRSELSMLMEKLAQEIAEERQQNQEKQVDQFRSNMQLQLLQEQFLLQLVKDHWYSMAAVKERLQQLQLTSMIGEEIRAQFIAMEMRVPKGRLSSYQERPELLQLAFQMLCRETADKYKQVYPFYDPTYPSMMFFLIIHDREQEPRTESFVKELKKNVGTYLQLDCVAGVGESVTGLKRMKNGFVSCMLSWSLSTAHAAHSANQVLEVAQAFSPETERRMIQAIENLDFDAFSSQIHAIFPPERETPMFTFTFLALRIILMFSSIAKKFEIGDPQLQHYLWNCQTTIATYQSKAQVVEQIMGLGLLVIEVVRKTRMSNGQQLVEAVRKYMDENYSYELTLSSIADLFHINETYLSGLFKQAFGITFSEYLTKLRLTKSQELLQQNELKLTDIAMLVGYSSSSYFSTAFKKAYGQSPKEYRDAYLANQTK